MDILFLSLIRNNVSQFIKNCANRFDRQDVSVLDIAPQIHKGAKEFFTKSNIYTLDIDQTSNADYIADICDNNAAIIPDNLFDIIICTEVLEHTLNPFRAVEEMYRILKKEGFICVSTPFNFRIHGPLPDCWRFTEHGLRSLFSIFSNLHIEEVKTPDRDLMPIHYTLIAQK